MNCERCLNLVDEGSNVCGRCGHRHEEPPVYELQGPEIDLSVEPSLFEMDPVDGDLTVPPELLASSETTEAAPMAPPASAPAAAPPPATLSPREMITLTLAVVGAGVVTLSLLMLRGDAAPSSAAAAAATPSAAAAKTASRPSAPRWSSGNSGRWVGNARRSIAFELPADNRVAVWTRHVLPLLVVRCSAGDLEVFVYTDTPAKMEPPNDDHTVRFAFDDDAETTERWPDSVDHDGLFARDADSFVRRLARARTLRFGFSPHNAEPVTVGFNVAGLREMLAPAAKECGGAH